MTLINLSMGETVTINGKSGVIAGLSGVDGKIAFIDLEPVKAKRHE